MEAHARAELKHAFVLTAESVSRLWKAIADAGMDVKASMSCSDGMVRHVGDLASLIQYENPARASIDRLEISGRSSEPYSSAEVTLGERYLAPIGFSIRGEEDLVSSLRTSISDTLSGLRPWYSWIATIPLFSVWLAIVAVLYLLLMTMLPSNTPRPAMPFSKAVAALAISLAVVGTIGLVVWGVALLRKRFFPVGVFAIGQGWTRYQQDDKFRWVVIIGFVVSLVASVVVAAVTAV